uniref:Uncharacterized protein n=1 Tax=Strongyloides stercoralis TaxID=6248 RepID=A0A0K0EQ27_STRER
MKNFTLSRHSRLIGNLYQYNFLLSSYILFEPRKIFYTVKEDKIYLFYYFHNFVFINTLINIQRDFERYSRRYYY